MSSNNTHHESKWHPVPSKQPGGWCPFVFVFKVPQTVVSKTTQARLLSHSCILRKDSLRLQLLRPTAAWRPGEGERTCLRRWDELWVCFGDPQLGAFLLLSPAALLKIRVPPNTHTHTWFFCMIEFARRLVDLQCCSEIPPKG